MLKYCKLFLPRCCVVAKVLLHDFHCVSKMFHLF